MPPRYTAKQKTLIAFTGVMIIIMTLSALFSINSTITHSSSSSSSVEQKGSSPEDDDDDDATPAHLNVRANKGNDGIKSWLGYEASELRKPISQLDAKGQAVKKGQGLESMMRASVESVAGSKFQEFGDLVRYGYRASFTDHDHNHNHDEDEDEGDDGKDNFIRDLGLSKAFGDLGITSRGWVQVSAGNSFDVRDPRDNSKVIYPASFATFSTEIHPGAGVIVATQSYGPEHMAKLYGVELQAGQKLTPLRKVSDVLFLSWMKLIHDRGVGDVGNLEHMFRWHTVVSEVQAHLSMVAGGRSIEEIGEWPGVSYPISELQGLATLSAPNARGVAWLLGQHKAAMGIKTVDRVNIFNCPSAEGEGQWCVYLHMVPVDA